MLKIKLGPHMVSADDPVFIIAEIGINHNGKLQTAKQLIDAAVSAGATCAKFQMRHLSSLYSNSGDSNDIRENLGSQYTLDLLNRFELKPAEMFEAFDYCRKRGIMPLCTPWDVETVKKLKTYPMQAYKVASADMTNHVLLRALAATRKPLIVSTGMSDESEIVQTAKLLKKLNASYILMHCNSTYPTPYKDVNLNYLHRLQKISGGPVGYSGHERGYSIPIAAVSLGAKVIEKHITLDREMEGSDHKVSLLPDEFKKMVDSIRAVEAALGSTEPRRITQGERMNRASLAKSLIATKDFKKGQRIGAKYIAAKSPGRGLQPNRIDDLVGKTAKRDLKAGDFFFASDLGKGAEKVKKFHFERPWGVSVRYHDFKILSEHFKPDFVEFHLSYKDMDQKPSNFLESEYDMGLTVHSPDLFAGDHLLNLASEKKEYRQKSIAHLQKVVDLTRKLKKYFKKAESPLIIVSLGGFSRDGFFDSTLRGEMYRRIQESLSQIDQSGVEIIGQTMPPFPWYFGGQYFSSLFVDPQDTVDFCSRWGGRLCFDISHSKLACNYFGWSFKDYVNKVGPYVAHMHIADAYDGDEEGLQIGSGDIDFKRLSRQLKKVAPSASFIPEIWQGHENSGEGFLIALKKLEKLF